MNQFQSEHPPRYLQTTNLSARVGRFYPDWMETLTSELENERFQKAMKYAGEEFLEVSAGRVWWR